MEVATLGAILPASLPSAGGGRHPAGVVDALPRFGGLGDGGVGYLHSGLCQRGFEPGVVRSIAPGGRHDPPFAIEEKSGARTPPPSIAAGGAPSAARLQTTTSEANRARAKNRFMGGEENVENRSAGGRTPHFSASRFF
jgi:hypothetical protein